MRRFRTRRRNGLCSVRVLLHLTEIDALVDRGFLKPERRDDQDAVESAIRLIASSATLANYENRLLSRLRVFLFGDERKIGPD